MSSENESLEAQHTEQNYVPDVFISYSSKNRDVADAIVTHLEEHGTKCWYAPRNILPGHEWVSAINDALKKAKIFILIYTAESNLSRQVMNEVALAFKAGMTLVPFRLSEERMNDELEYYLTRVHWLDSVSRPLDESIVALQNYVDLIMGRAQTQGTGANTDKAPDDGERRAAADGTPAVDVRKAAANDARPAGGNVTLGTSANEKQKEKKKGSRLALWIALAAAALVLIIGGAIAIPKLSGPSKDQLMEAGFQALYLGTYGTEDDAKARENYMQAAQKGAADAYYYLGEICEREYDYQSAREEYEKGIRAGSNLARLGMGYLWQRGLCGEADANKAWELYNDALDQGCEEADYYRAMIILSGFAGQEAEAKKAIKLYNNVIEESENPVFIAKAYNQLGEIYRKGTMTVPKDYDKAIESYLKVFETLNSKYYKLVRNYNLGLTYKAMGEEVKADDYFRAAHELILEMAEDGFVYCMFWEGNCLCSGVGVKQDLQEAIKWFQTANEAAKERSKKARCYQALVRLGDLQQDEQDYEKAFEYYKEASDFGYGTAADKIGDMYVNGIIGQDAEGNADYHLARQWYEKAIEHGCSDAYQSIGYLYSEGKGVEVDETKALEYYQRGAELGSGACAYNIGIVKSRSEEYEDALNWYFKAADMGYENAYYAIASYYSAGRGTDKDEDKAVEYYQKAAQAENVSPQNRIYAITCLMEDYYYGYSSAGVNYQEAFYWAKKGAELNDKECALLLGIMYVNCDEIEEDYAEAEKWLKVAARAGSDQASYLLGVLYLEGGNGVAASEIDAIWWLTQAANNGNFEAQKQLISVYLNKEDPTEEERQRAFGYLRWLAEKYEDSEKEDPEWWLKLGRMCITGWGTDINEELAYAYYARAYDKGASLEKDELYLLGFAYYQGFSMFGKKIESQEKSFEILKRLAEAAYPDAYYMVGLMYYAGLGTDINYVEAFHWLSAALDHQELTEQQKEFCHAAILAIVNAGYVSREEAQKWL